MEFKFEYNDETEGTLKFRGNAEHLFDSLEIFGSSIGKLLNDNQLPVSTTLLPLILAVAETEGKTSQESANDLLVEMQKNLEVFCKLMEKELNSANTESIELVE